MSTTFSITDLVCLDHFLWEARTWFQIVSTSLPKAPPPDIINRWHWNFCWHTNKSKVNDFFLMIHSTEICAVIRGLQNKSHLGHFWIEFSIVEAFSSLQHIHSLFVNSSTNSLTRTAYLVYDLFWIWLGFIAVRLPVAQYNFLVSVVGNIVICQHLLPFLSFSVLRKLWFIAVVHNITVDNWKMLWQIFQEVDLCY